MFSSGRLRVYKIFIEKEGNIISDHAILRFFSAQLSAQEIAIQELEKGFYKLFECPFINIPLGPIESVNY